MNWSTVKKVHVLIWHIFIQLLCKVISNACSRYTFGLALLFVLCQKWSFIPLLNHSPLSPIPAFKLALLWIHWIKSFLLNYLEPIGSSKPKFSEDINSKGITRQKLNAVTLVCPAQGFPLPSFRFVAISHFYFGFQLCSNLHSQVCCNWIIWV